MFLKSIYSDANIYSDRKFEKYNQFYINIAAISRNTYGN